MKPFLFSILPQQISFCLTVIISLLFSSALTLAESKKQPNLLLILSDDQGYGQLGAFSDLFKVSGLPTDSVKGMNNDLLQKHLSAAKNCMPELDQLAKNGLRLTNLQAAHTCAPSRMMLMSGLYPQRSGVYTNLDINKIGAPKELPFLVKNIKNEGYRTGLIGKWHLGLEEGQHPLDKGFEYFFGFDLPGTDKYKSKDLFRGRKSAAPNGFLADQMTEEALAFIKDESKPFFLYLSYNEPHGPLPKPPAQYAKPFSSVPRAQNFYGALRSMDHGIGRIVAALKKSGRLENTVIVFASDNGAINGAPLPRNGHFRGGKRTVYDGGLKVPALIHYPALISSARDYSESLSIGDIMPTLLEIAGIKIPENLDGQSFHAALTGSSKPIHDTPLFWASETKILTAESKVAFRKWKEENRKRPAGTRLWHSAGRPAAWSASMGQWKAIKAEGYPLWLFNTKNDPGETNNVADAHPEIVKKLKSQYKLWLAKMSKPIRWYDSKWEALNAP